MKIKSLIILAAAISSSALLQAASLEPIRSHCTISPNEKPGSFRLEIGDSDCRGNRHCGSSMNDESLSRFTGVTRADLAHDGAHLTATMTAEAGTFTCTGVVDDGALTGDSVFTPDPAFVSRMAQMGFTGYDSDKLLGYAFLNVETAWVQSLQAAHITGMNIDNIVALRVFNVEPSYIQSMASLGYDVQPTADQLIALRSQGVDAAEVREIRALGYKPTLDELIQIRIFKITPDFIHRMQARGFKDLTIAKLVQIRIFKLAE
jgi:hypothetical protein